MTELASHTVDLFEAGRVEEVRPAFELAEHLIAVDPDGERDAAVVDFRRRFRMWLLIENMGRRLSSSSSGRSLNLLGGIDQRVARQDESGRRRCIGNRSNTPTALVAVLEKRDRRLPSELLNEVQNPELRKIIEQITRE